RKEAYGQSIQRDRSTTGLHRIEHDAKVRGIRGSGFRNRARQRLRRAGVFVAAAESRCACTAADHISGPIESYASRLHSVAAGMLYREYCIYCTEPSSIESNGAN